MSQFFVGALAWPPRVTGLISDILDNSAVGNQTQAYMGFEFT